MKLYNFDEAVSLMKEGKHVFTSRMDTVYFYMKDNVIYNGITNEVANISESDKFRNWRICKLGFDEAIIKLKQGKKLRLDYWRPNEYICLSKTNNIIRETGRPWLSNEVDGIHVNEILIYRWEEYNDNEENV